MCHKINRIALVVVIICISSVVTSAQTIADSLKKVLSGNLSPEEKVMNTGYLARSLSLTNTEEGIKLGQQALLLSRGLKDKKYTTFVYGTLVQLYYQQNREMEKAQKAVDSAIWYSEKTDDKVMKGFAWYRKAWLQNLRGKNGEVVASGLQALKYLSGTGAYNYEASVYYILTGIYGEQRDSTLEKKYADLSLKTSYLSGDYDNLISAYQALATYWHYRYKEKQDHKPFLDTALSYNRKAINTYLANKHRIIFNSTIAVIALNTSNLYSEYFPESYKDSVLHYVKIARQLGLETHQMVVVANSYGLMSEFEMRAKNYKKTEEILLEGLSVLNSDSARNTANKIQFLTALSDVAEIQGDLKSCIKYLRQYQILYKELYNEDKLKITKRLEAQYQTEKNETELKTLQQTAALNKKLNYLYIGVILLAVIAGSFIFWSLRLKLKTTVQEKEDAALLAQIKQQEYEQMELNAKLKEEETMRLLAEQQLLQERQERLQRDLLAGSLQVEQKDELLLAVQKKIEENSKDNTVLKQINKIIDQNKKIDGEFAAYKADFDNIHPEFFEKLKERSANSLSRLDLKHCSYISIGLTNKEIAQRLNIAPKSILMARYRIKLKLGLGKDTDLDEYIRKL